MRRVRLLTIRALEEPRLMPRKSTSRSLVAAALLVTSLDAGIARAQAPDIANLPPYKADAQLHGALRVYGNWMRGNMQKLVDGFKKAQPDLEIATNFSTSSEGAIAGLYVGIADVAPAGDDGKMTDIMPFYNVFHYLPTEISIATGGWEKRGTLWPAAIVVNKDNPLAHLSMDQLARVFGSQRTGGWQIFEDGADHNELYTSKYAWDGKDAIRTWGQFGLTGEWADKPIQTYGYISPGFKIYLERKLFHWSSKWNENFKEYVEAKQATDDADGKAVASEAMLETLSKDRFGFGWAAMLHVKDYPNVKVLAVAEKEGGPYVPLTPDTVANRSYPLKRDDYIYINKQPGRPAEPKVREFIRFILSRDGQQIIKDHGLYSPLPADMIQTQLKKLD